MGNDHLITATLEFDYGDGAGFVAAGPGEAIDFTVANSNGSDGSLSAPSVVTDGNGQAQVTLSSTTTGDSEVDASWNGDILTATASTATTDDTDADKNWVDARLTLSPLTDDNQVGNDHLITATLEFDYGDGAGFVAAGPGEAIDFTVANSNGSDGSLSAPSVVTDGNGQAQVTLSSTTTGDSEVDASWNGDILTATASTATTDDTDADKNWVDARLTLSPLTDDNQVGNDHLITATLEFDYGDGAGFVAAGPGEAIDFTVANSNGSDGSLSAPSVVTDGNGQAQVTLSSTTTGDSEVDASWNGDILTATASTATTDDTDADKNWVDARLTLSPLTDTNRAGDDHLITATLEFDYGDGAGFVAAGPGEAIDFTVANSNGSDGSLSAPSVVTDGNGQAQVTLSSTTTGDSEVDASWNGSIQGQYTSASASVATTDDTDAEKLWVDAKITIDPPEATNFLNDPHTLTANVMEDLGDGSGFVDAAGETVVFVIDGDATFIADAGVTLNPDGDASTNDASVVTDSNGDAIVRIESDTIGDNTITASSDVSVGGIDVSVVTDGSTTPSGGVNSDPAEKLYISGLGQITPTGTTCDDYITGTAEDFEDYYDFQNGDIQYSDNNKNPGLVNSVNPGVFFYYTGLGGFIKDDDGTGTEDGQFTIAIDQENKLVSGSTVDDFPLFTINSDGLKLFEINDLNLNGEIDAEDTCQQVQLITDPKGQQVANAVITIVNDDVTFTYLDADPDALYVVSVKYETDAVEDTRFAAQGFDPNEGTTPTINYTFETFYEGALSETDDQGGVNLSYKFDPDPDSPVPALTLDGDATVGGEVLTEDELAPVIDAAIDYWAEQGVDCSRACSDSAEDGCSDRGSRRRPFGRDHRRGCQDR